MTLQKISYMDSQALNTWKCSVSSLSEKCNLKAQWKEMSFYTPPEWLQLQNWQWQMLLRMCNNWNSSKLLLGISNGTVILEGCVTDSYKAKYDTEIPFLDRYAKQMKICTHKKTCTCHGWSMPGSKGSFLSLNTTKSIFSKDSCTIYPFSLLATLLHWEAGCLFPLLESNGLLYLPQPIELNKWYSVTSLLDHKEQFGFHLALTRSGYVLGDYRWQFKNLAPLSSLLEIPRRETTQRYRSMRSFSCYVLFKSFQPRHHIWVKMLKWPQFQPPSEDTAWEILIQNYPGKLLQNSGSGKPGNIIDGHCFKPLSFGMLCSAAIVIYNTEGNSEEPTQL